MAVIPSAPILHASTSTSPLVQASIVPFPQVAHATAATTVAPSATVTNTNANARHRTMSNSQHAYYKRVSPRTSSSNIIGSKNSNLNSTPSSASSTASFANSLSSGHSINGNLGPRHPRKRLESGGVAFEQVLPATRIMTATAVPKTPTQRASDVLLPSSTTTTSKGFTQSLPRPRMLIRKSSSMDEMHTLPALQEQQREREEIEQNKKKEQLKGHHSQRGYTLATHEQVSPSPVHPDKAVFDAALLSPMSVTRPRLISTSSAVSSSSRGSASASSSASSCSRSKSSSGTLVGSTRTYRRPAHASTSPSTVFSYTRGGQLPHLVAGKEGLPVPPPAPARSATTPLEDTATFLAQTTVCGGSTANGSNGNKRERGMTFGSPALSGIDPVQMHDRKNSSPVLSTSFLPSGARKRSIPSTGNPDTTRGGAAAAAAAAATTTAAARLKPLYIAKSGSSGSLYASDVFYPSSPASIRSQVSPVSSPIAAVHSLNHNSKTYNHDSSSVVDDTGVVPSLPVTPKHKRHASQLPLKLSLLAGDSRTAIGSYSNEEDLTLTLRGDRLALMDLDLHLVRIEEGEETVWELRVRQKQQSLPSTVASSLSSSPCMMEMSLSPSAPEMRAALVGNCSFSTTSSSCESLVETPPPVSASFFPQLESYFPSSPFTAPKEKDFRLQQQRHYVVSKCNGTGSSNTPSTYGPAHGRRSRQVSSVRTPLARSRQSTNTSGPYHSPLTTSFCAIDDYKTGLAFGGNNANVGAFNVALDNMSSSASKIFRNASLVSVAALGVGSSSTSSTAAAFHSATSMRTRGKSSPTFQTMLAPVHSRESDGDDDVDNDGNDTGADGELEDNASILDHYTLPSSMSCYRPRSHSRPSRSRHSSVGIGAALLCGQKQRGGSKISSTSLHMQPLQPQLYSRRAQDSITPVDNASDDDGENFVERLKSSLEREVAEDAGLLGRQGWSETEAETETETETDTEAETDGEGIMI